MAAAGSAAVAKDAVREGKGREGAVIVTAANQGQIASDTAGSGVK
jgi:hypothetical protein